jgi:hypothetical protein
MDSAQQTSWAIDEPLLFDRRTRMVLETGAFIAFGLTHPHKVPRIPMRSGGGPPAMDFWRGWSMGRPVAAGAG